MALPNTGITTSMVGAAIGSSSRDVGALCTHLNVNKWSRHKPVMGVDLEFPVNIPSSLIVQTQDSYVDFDENGNIIIPPFIYKRPTGGVNSPYRLGDFRGYNHQAEYPFVFPSNLSLNLHYTNTIQFNIKNQNAEIPLALIKAEPIQQWTETVGGMSREAIISNASDMRIKADLYSGNTKVLTWINNDILYNEDGYNVNLEIQSPGTYTVRLYLYCDSPNTFYQPVQINKDAPVTITVVNQPPIAVERIDAIFVTTAGNDTLFSGLDIDIPKAASHIGSSYRVIANVPLTLNKSELNIILEENIDGLDSSSTTVSTLFNLVNTTVDGNIITISEGGSFDIEIRRTITVDKTKAYSIDYSPASLVFRHNITDYLSEPISIRII